MTLENHDINLLALIRFAFDMPPRSPRLADIIDASSLYIGNDGRVQFVSDADRHTVVGITAANWIMIVGVSWRHVHRLTSRKRRAIATACNAMQSQPIQNRAKVLVAMTEYWAEQVA